MLKTDMSDGLACERLRMLLSTSLAHERVPFVWANTPSTPFQERQRLLVVAPSLSMTATVCFESRKLSNVSSP
jgi:hypothetical protein